MAFGGRGGLGESRKVGHARHQKPAVGGRSRSGKRHREVRRAKRQEAIFAISLKEVGK